jgi:hypothetical protein
LIQLVHSKSQSSDVHTFSSTSAAASVTAAEHAVAKRHAVVALERQHRETFDELQQRHAHSASARCRAAADDAR